MIVLCGQRYTPKVGASDIMKSFWQGVLLTFIVAFFSHEAWVKTDQRNAMQESGECWRAGCICLLLGGSSCVSQYRAELKCCQIYLTVE
jgi:hypothetical protein